jgi:hypothetical protein
MTTSNRFFPGGGQKDGFEWAIQPDGDYFFYPWGGNNTNYNFVSNPFTNGKWHHLVVTLEYSTKNVIFYLDGSSLTLDVEYVPTRWTQLAILDDWIWGGDVVHYKFFTGIFDEIRVSDIVRDVDWIQTEYNNQQDPQSFFSVGEVEDSTKPGITPSPEPWYDTTWPYRNKITINHSLVGELPWFDTNWLYRKKITITSGSIAIPTGYSVNVTFNHSNLVTNGKSKVNGEDVRILYWNGATWDELDRMLDPSSSWNGASTKIWFKTQEVISSSASNDDYYLYYGNALATSPSTNSSNVFFFYDGFESGNLSAWSGFGEGSAGDSISSSTDQANTGSYSAKCVMDSVASPQAMVYEDVPDESNLFARIQIYLDPSLSITDRLTVMQYIDTSPGWQNLLSVTIDQDMTLYMWNAYDGEAYGYQVGNTISKGSWHTLEMQAKISETAGEARLWLDGQLEIEATGINLSTDRLITRFAAGIYWAGDNEPNTLYIDDGFLRPWLSSEPNATLGNEMEQSILNFPVLISKTDTNWKDINNEGYVGQSDGGDIFFTSLDGTTKVAHEIEKYNPTTGELIVWVNVPVLSSIIDTSILMYYGNDAAINQENPEGVWDSNFIAIHHLEDDPSGSVYDSTNNDADGITNGSMNSGNLVDAWIGKGYDFDGIDDGVLSSSSVSISSFTYSAWFKQGPNFSSWRSIVSVGSGRQFASHNRRAAFWSGANPDDFFGNSGDLLEGNWHYGTIIYDGSTYLKAFINGSQVGTIHYKSMGPVTDTFEIGVWRPSNPSDWFDGIIDEVRISNISRTEDWIFTEWKNQLDPNSFYSVGSLQTFDNNSWAFPLFNFRKRISIDSSKVNGTSYLIDFPVLLNITDTDLHDPNKVQSDGDDIVFSDIFGNKLNYEIELFDQNGNGTHAHLIAWVEVPFLSGIKDTDIMMYYGNKAVGSQVNPSDMWTNDYVGIWHLTEDPSGPSPQILDSTSNSIDGISVGDMTSGDQVSGQIYQSLNFDGSDDYINLGTNSSLKLTSAFTIEGWYNGMTDTGINDRAPIFVSGFSWAGMIGIRLQGFHQSTDKRARITYGNGTYMSFIDSDSAINENTWTHIVATFDGTTLKLFINGVKQTDEAIITVAYNSDAAAIGGTINNSQQRFNGSLDEIRVSSAARSSDWIATEYNNQFDPSIFYSVNSEDINEYWWADSTFSKRKDIVIDYTQFGLTQSNELYDIPFLIELYDSDLKTKVQKDGNDILFFDSEGNKLDHEIDEFNQAFNITHAHLLSWVRIPSLKLKEDTIISMYYGNSQVLSQENPEGVWTDDYIAVWHLDESGNGTVDEYKDSTTNNNDGQGGGDAGIGGGASPPSQITGQIGYGQEFDESIREHIEVPTSVSLESPSNSITIVGWVNAFISGLDGGIIFSNWGYGLNFLNGEILGHLNGTTNNVTSWVWWPTNDYTSLGWHQYALSYDGSFERLYIDGSLVNIAECTGTIAIGDPNPNTLRIGSNPTWGTPGATGYIDGQIDEVRISKTTKSADWIQIEFINQDDPDSLYFVSSEYELDTTPPVLDNFGVEDPGTGTGEFWADVTDIHSSVDSVLIKINGTEYSMSSNGSHWIKQLSVDFGKYYEYQIVNASDVFGNFLVSPSSNKSYTFNLDNITPDVLDWEYVSANNTFQANVTDSWGSIDTVIVNVTTHTLTASMVYYNTFSSTKLAYMNNTLSMPNGPIDFLIFVNDTSGNQFSSTTHSGNVYSNTAPVASNVTLSRDQFLELLPIFSNSTLYLYYNYSDAESQSEAGTEIRWYKDNGTGFILQTNRNDSKSIPISALYEGDQWYASVKPKDGELFGNLVNSSIITVQNTPPQISSVVVSPSDPDTSQSLLVSNTTIDPDNEPIIAYEVRWFNPTLNSSYTNFSTIPSDQTKKGETWWCELRAFDGTNYSVWFKSNNVTIRNSTPTASNLAISPSTPKTHHTLSASYTFSDADGDGESGSLIRWYQNEILQVSLNDSLIVDSTLTSKGDTWYFTVTPYDGSDYGGLQTSSTVTIENTAPAATNLQITPTSPITTDILNASYTFSDNDSDTQTGSYIIWYKNSILQGALNDSNSVGSSYTSKGEIWHFKVRPSDGTDYGNWESCPTNVTIGNTGPSASNVYITPSDPKTGDDLVANYDYSDPDSDAESGSELIWYLNGVLQGGLNGSFTVGAGNTSKTEEWHFKVRPKDGTDFGVWIGSTNITIGNTTPVASSLTITPNNPVTHQNLTATYSFFDADGDGDSGSKIRWYRNGMLQGNLNDSLLVNSSLTTKGESWYFTVEPNDGTSYGNLQTSGTVTIENSAPNATDLQITPGSPVAADILNASYSYTDNDTDTEIGTLIIWYKNGVLQGGLNDSDEVSASYTAKNDEWHYKVRPSDGTDYGSWISCPTNVTIGNTGPNVSNVNLKRILILPVPKRGMT